MLVGGLPRRSLRAERLRRLQLGQRFSIAAAIRPELALTPVGFSGFTSTLQLLLTPLHVLDVVLSGYLSTAMTATQLVASLGVVWRV